MGRQPQQIHIYLYRTTPEGKKEYAVFQRSDDPACRQGVYGGIENNETLEEGAGREILEEAGITARFPCTVQTASASFGQYFPYPPAAGPGRRCGGSAHVFFRYAF